MLRGWSACNTVTIRIVHAFNLLYLLYFYLAVFTFGHAIAIYNDRFGRMIVYSAVIIDGLLFALSSANTYTCKTRVTHTKGSC